MRFQLFPDAIAFGIAFAFLVGIFSADIGWDIAIVVSVAVICLGSAFLRFKKYRTEIIFFFLALVVGIGYVHIYLYWRTAHIIVPFGKQITFSAVVSDEPLASEKYLILTTAVQKPLEGTVKILAPPGSDIRYGDLIAVSGVIEEPETSVDDPIIFSPKQIVIKGSHYGFFLREWLIDLKLGVMERFMAMLNVDEVAFLGGILFGSKMGVSDALKSALSLTGTTHLIAVSGYKVTLVIVTVGELFSRIFSRRSAFIASIIFLVLFILMVGFEASAVRAAIMGVIALVAREAGETINIRNAVTFTALFMALVDPTILTNDLSFMISFLAVLGIIYLGPPFKKLFHYKDEGMFGWKEAGITTLGAQLATMPILMNAFGQFSLVAIPANICTLSLLPLTMFFGFMLACVGAVSGHIAFFTAKIVGLIIGYQLAVIRLFAAIAVPLPLSFSSAFAIFLYYLILCLFAFSYKDNDDFAKI